MFCESDFHFIASVKRKKEKIKTALFLIPVLPVLKWKAPYIMSVVLSIRTP